MVELMREVGFGIPVMPQGAFYVFADASRWTDDSYQFAFELLERAPAERVGRGRRARRGFRRGGEEGGEVQLRQLRGENQGSRQEARGVPGEEVSSLVVLPSKTKVHGQPASGSF